MISIIVCSINADKYNCLVNNINSTISYPHEFVIIDNSIQQWGICKAYNWGARKAKGEYLCFIHEDILIETNDWGQILTTFIQSTSNCGVVGFAGGAYVARNHISWFVDCRRENYIFPSEDGTSWERRRTGYEQKKFGSVITLDGLFLFMRKSVWQETEFDEKNFDGFHFYDMDISTAIWLKGYQNFVCYSIDIRHFSRGDYSGDYLKYSSLFREKYSASLPLCITGITIKKQLLMEIKQAFSYWCYAKKMLYTRKMLFLEFRKTFKFYSITIFLLMELLWLRHKIKAR